jgi:hypothetical protein
VNLRRTLSTAGGLGCGFKRVFDLLVKHAAEYRSIPSEALRPYWLRRVSVSLQNGMANCFYKHVGRANTPSFYDECLGHDVVSVWVMTLCLHSLMLVLFLFPTEEGLG